jgi:proteasome lid subunit RPN8/RPN11
MARADKKSRKKKDRDVASAEEAAPTIVTRDLARDVGNIDAAEWPHRDWPAASGEPRGAGFGVVVKRSVLNAVNRHGQSAPNIEVCGVLVGNVCRDAAGPFLHVEAAIRGDFAGGSAAQVTFTAETWSHIQGVMEREHPDQRIVGWYHTHPGFGIFLSDMDLFIHGNFFNLPWQVAFVYDPVSGEEGMFVWREGKAQRGEFAVEEDVEKEIPTVAVSPEIGAAALADFSRRVQRMEQRLRLVAVALPFVILIALAWPFVIFTILADRNGRGQAPVVDAGRGSKVTELPAVTQPVTTRPAAVETVVTTIPASGPTTDKVVEVVVPPATVPSTQAAAVAGTQPATRPEESPELIRLGPTTQRGGPKVLEPPGEK